MSFDRFIRFVDENNVILYGNLLEALPSEKILGLEVEILSGNPKEGFSKTSQKATVVKESFSNPCSVTVLPNTKQLLNPLTNTPLVLCAGLNYHLHVEETKSFLPEKPVLFMTPAERLCGPLDQIMVHERAQPMLDYEGELAFVIGRDAKNVKEEDALDFVLGYTIANDVSARNLVTMEVAFNQMGHSKSFDTFGPIGPCIASTKLIEDPHRLRLVTRVNGEIRQDSHTSDMIWTIKQLLAWASENRTIKCGTVIMTGTPSGVGWHSDGLLKDGDIIEVEIENIGSIVNKVVFI